MPLVTLLFPDDDAGPDSPMSFAVAPRPGDSVLLNVGGKRRFFLIDETFHGMTSDGAEVLYFARLRRAPDTASAAPCAEAQF